MREALWSNPTSIKFSQEPIIIYEINNSFIGIANNPTNHKSSKIIDNIIPVNMLREINKIILYSDRLSTGRCTDEANTDNQVHRIQNWN